MAAQPVPSKDRRLRPYAEHRGGVLQRSFARKSPATRSNLGHHGPAAVQVPAILPVRRRGFGMSGVSHISVLGREAVEWLAPRAGGVYVDATFGAGGYSRAVLQIPATRVVGIDRDRSAIAGGFDLVDGSDGRLVLVEDRFSELAEVCATQGLDAVDGVVMDVGVSSMQLDQAERGFSFRLGGPLDMRMGQSGPTAADVIARASET